MNFTYKSIGIAAFCTLIFSVVAAQTEVNSSSFGTLEARVLGPGTMSGRISAIEGVDAENGKTLYIGTAGGGIWKTTNAGASFKPVFDKYCQSIGAIAIDQKNPKVVYAGTGESNMRNSVSIGNGFYKSTDAGSNWSKTGALDSTEHIAKIAIDPSNSNTIYVAAPGPLWSDSKHRGLYKSVDAGKTFEKILFISDKAGCADISIDPSNPNTLYATTWEFRRTPTHFHLAGKEVASGKAWMPAKPGNNLRTACQQNPLEERPWPSPLHPPTTSWPLLKQNKQACTFQPMAVQAGNNKVLHSM